MKLVFAATARCPCGARLAYDPESDERAWDCSGILLDVARPDVTHTAKLPFVFYEIKSES